MSNRHRNLLKSVKTIVFDWDGTLHESMHIYKPAFLEAYAYLVKNNHASQKVWQDEEVSRFLGITPKEMWESFRPRLEEPVINAVGAIISTKMMSLIREKKARLYANSLEVLRFLRKKDYTLVYLSNSKTYYMDAMVKTFGLRDFFDHIVCSEMHDFDPKHKILEKMMPMLKKDVVVIGDRELDIQTGKHNQAFTIGCSYGYGTIEELKDADVIIQDIKDLLDIL